MTLMTVTTHEASQAQSVKLGSSSFKLTEFELLASQLLEIIYTLKFKCF